jgi:hypothetical protein
VGVASSWNWRRELFVKCTGMIVRIQRGIQSSVPVEFALCLRKYHSILAMQICRSGYHILSVCTPLNDVNQSKWQLAEVHRQDSFPHHCVVTGKWIFYNNRSLVVWHSSSTAFLAPTIMAAELTTIKLNADSHLLLVFPHAFKDIHICSPG